MGFRPLWNRITNRICSRMMGDAMMQETNLVIARLDKPLAERGRSKQAPGA